MRLRESVSKPGCTGAFSAGRARVRVGYKIVMRGFFLVGLQEGGANRTFLGLALRCEVIGNLSDC